MKKFLITGYGILLNTLLAFAQTEADSTNVSIDGTTSGYSNAGTIGLVVLILVIVAVIIAFTWRRKNKLSD